MTPLKTPAEFEAMPFALPALLKGRYTVCDQERVITACATPEDAAAIVTAINGYAQMREAIIKIDTESNEAYYSDCPSTHDAIAEAMLLVDKRLTE